MTHPESRPAFLCGEEFGNAYVEAREKALENRIKHPKYVLTTA
jgi:hypothetical protein